MNKLLCLLALALVSCTEETPREIEEKIATDKAELEYQLTCFHVGTFMERCTNKEVACYYWNIGSAASISCVKRDMMMEQSK